MQIKKVIKMFENGSVFVSGMRGTGKDMLFANVVSRRKLPYISNVDYGGEYIPLDLSKLDCKNNYVNFVSRETIPYYYPYEDGIDVYISDSGVYFPSQYNDKLDRKYDTLSTSIALSRHLGDCNWHFNSQSIARVWNKFREQSETYIRCNKCKVIGKIVFQTITIYDNVDSCNNNVPPFPVNIPFLAPQSVQLSYKLMKVNYTVQYGNIKRKRLVYINKSNYNTRIFKEILQGE